MNPLRLRERRTAVTAVALVALAVLAQSAEVTAVANVPPPDPRIALTLFPSDAQLLATGWWILQGALAMVALGFGIAATLRPPGRIIGAMAAVLALIVLVA